MKKSNKFSPEVRERAVRMVQEHRGEYPSVWGPLNPLPPSSVACRERLTNGEAGRGRHRQARRRHVKSGQLQVQLASKFGDGQGNAGATLVPPCWRLRRFMQLLICADKPA